MKSYTVTLITKIELPPTTSLAVSAALDLWAGADVEDFESNSEYRRGQAELIAHMEMWHPDDFMGTGDKAEIVEDLMRREIALRDEESRNKRNRAPLHN